LVASRLQIDAVLRTRLSSYKVQRQWLEIGRSDGPVLPSNKLARRARAGMIAERVCGLD